VVTTVAVEVASAAVQLLSVTAAEGALPYQFYNASSLLQLPGFPVPSYIEAVGGQTICTRNAD